MLDELWLRACRSLVQGLESRGLWLADERFEPLREERKHTGAQLLETLVVPALAEDANALGAERIFGIGNFRLRARLPLSLAFGFDLATQILVPPGGATPSEAANLAALFNFGIALLDRTLDTLDAGGRAITALLDEARLRALIEDPQAHRDLRRASASIASVEARIVIRVVCAFFAHLHAAGIPPPATLLLEAYRAEMVCVRGRELSPRASLEAAQRKSTLPFALVGRLARDDADTDALAKRIGTVFWLLDDVVDLVRDLESGDANALVLAASEAVPRLQDEREPVARLLDSNAVEESVEALCDNLNAARTAAPFMDPLVLMYVRNWIPRRVFAGRVRPRG
jgi:hypothetical protein